MWKVQVQKKKRKLLNMQVQPVCTKKKNEPGGPKVLNNQT